ncbi:hypothetical protein SLA2020_355810 [Shorea laevis]
MLKQTAAARNHRDKGFKVKHVLQAFVLLGLCIWLLNQIRHSYGNKQAFNDGNGSISEKLRGEHGGIKLGRKDLNPQVELSKRGDNKGGENEEEEEVEEIKPEEGDDEGRGGGDDEIDGQDQEKTEEEESEVEDLIDEEDREKENQIEDSSLMEGQIENEGEEDSQEAREENYKGDDASSAVLQKSITMGNGAQIQRLRKLDGWW